MGVIIANVLVMAMDHYGETSKFQLAMSILNYTFTSIFILEMIVKVGACVCGGSVCMIVKVDAYVCGGAVCVGGWVCTHRCVREVATPHPGGWEWVRGGGSGCVGMGV